jgi:hypothetical protein
MSLGKYPINRIKSVPPSLYKKGYSIWFWEVINAYECPIEPLTDEFWSEKMNSFLVFGTILPAVLVTDKADLLILVARDLKYTASDQGWGLSLRQMHELFDLIVQIDFKQAEGLSLMPVVLRVNFFKAFADVFKEYVLPFKDKNGKYVRNIFDESESGFLKPDEMERVQCSSCNRLIAPQNGLIILEKYTVSDGSMCIFAICEHCETMLAIRARPPQGAN